MTNDERAAQDTRHVVGIPLIFGERMNAAHTALLEFARDFIPDRWPDVPSCLRFADAFGVDARELAALCGILSFRRSPGGRVVWVDAYRHPEVARRTSPSRLAPRLLSAYGCYVAAMTLIARDRARARGAIH